MLVAPTISSGKPRAASNSSTSLVDLVNPMQGTNSNYGFSVGNTLPLVTRPFGMIHWTAQSNTRDGWFFDPNAHKLVGIRATHQPSPWMGDYGQFTIMAQSGYPVYDPDARAIAYTDEQFVVHPNYLSFDLADQGIRIETSPTERCAIFRFTFPAGKPTRVILDSHTSIDIDVKSNTFTGTSRLAAGGTPHNFAHYFYASFDTPFVGAVAIQDGKPLAGQTQANTGKVAASFEFSNTQTVVMRIGTSFISADQARKNLVREVGSRTLDDVHKEAADSWNEALGTVLVEGGTIDDRRTFYSCLYRTQLFPRPIHEFDDSGKAIHYSPYDGKIYHGPLYADTGLWDGYHTLYPLLSLVAPDRLGEVIAGFIDAYKESNWLQQWPSPGYRGTMGATHSDSLFAEAINKKLDGFDPQMAYAAILKDSTVAAGGRGDLQFYIDHGYVPGSVSNSLDYAYDDNCVALAAQTLGRTDDYTTLSKRALNYRNVYDPSVGFMRPRNRDGAWIGDFDQFYWGGPYTEGGPWQWSFSAPHDPAGLISLMGGQTTFLRKLDKFLLQPPIFHTGGYGQTIHEMKEMAAVQFGQYAQSNQPVHQNLYLFTAAGCPWKTQYWARRVMDKLYSADVFPGDEDNGEMAAWYVLNAIGLFPSCPGHPSFTIGSPLFDKVTIKLKHRKSLVIEAKDNAPHKVYVNNITFNGNRRTQTWMSYANLMGGGTLNLQMGSAPEARTFDAEDLPYSLTPYENFSSGPDIWKTSVFINCGGDATGKFVGDCFVTGGNSGLAPAQTPGSTPAVDPAVLTTCRTGTFRYDIPIPMLPNGGEYIVAVTVGFDGGTPGIILNGVAEGTPGKDEPTWTGTFGFPHILPTEDGCITIATAAPNARIYAIEVSAFFGKV